MKKRFFLLLSLCALSCIKDNGNYKYSPQLRIEIGGIPEKIDVLASSDMITINPTFISKVDGKVITENNPNYSVVYRMQLASGGKITSGGDWPIMNPRENWSLDTMANFNKGNYIVEVRIYDKIKLTSSTTTFKLNISTSVYEGWLVLCNEGKEKRARLDMISLIGGKKKTIYDVLTPLGMPTSYNAYSVAFLPTLFDPPGDRIYVLTESGCYVPDSETMEINKTNPFLSTIKYIDFIIYPSENFVKICPAVDGVFGISFNLLISESGDTYGISDDTAGAMFEDLINTDVANTPAKYKVAPFIGQNAMFENGVYGIGSSVKASLFFDLNSKSFLVRADQTPESSKIMTPLIAPIGTGKLFETQNTGMEMVWMENSIFDNGTTYAIMQDVQGKRHIYGFNSVGQFSFTQSSLDANIAATRFNEAKIFAFSSLFAHTYYAIDNVVYGYDRGNKSSKVVLTLPIGEKIRVLKFNLFQNSPEYINDTSVEFWAQQYNLIVCSYDDTKLGVNNGTVRFLSVDGSTNTLSEVEKHSGFADVVDIVYRERR